MESSADISKDEFNSVSDLVIDENAENEEEEGKKMKSFSFHLDCADGSKGDCDDVNISQETCGTDFMKASEETEKTVTVMECTTESDDDNLDDAEEEDKEEEEGEEGQEGEEEEEDDYDSYPPVSQNIHRPRYIKAEDSSNSGGDIEQKWTNLLPGEKLPR